MRKLQKHHLFNVGLFLATIVLTVDRFLLNSTINLNQLVERDEEILAREQGFKMADNTSGATSVTKEDAALRNIQQEDDELALLDLESHLRILEENLTDRINEPLVQSGNVSTVVLLSANSSQVSPQSSLTSNLTANSTSTSLNQSSSTEQPTNKQTTIATSSTLNQTTSTEQSTNNQTTTATSTSLNQSSSPQLLTSNQALYASSDPLMCPFISPHLSGQVKIRREAPPMQELENNFETRLQLGGRYSTPDCHSRHRVAIIVPYRNRSEQLPVFLQHMHDFLPRQQLDYTIYVVEQAGNESFNRAVLMNIGVVEASKQGDFQCFVFHDIDLLPEDDRNIYSCPEQPRHMSVAINTYNYNVEKIFGGVSAVSKSHVEKVNGFSNMFWGWGGEDDDMYNRIQYYNLTIARYPADIARYTMLSHKKADPNPKRYEVLRNGAKRAQSDGLSSLRYKLLKVELKRLYTWILAEIHPS